MCIIIDANVAGTFFSNPTKDDHAPIFKWIEKRDGKLVYGGRLADELFKMSKPRRYLLRLRQAGKAILADQGQVDETERHLKATGRCQSNDPHVIALAQVTNARVLFSHDKALHRDFLDPTLVACPRGKVYQTWRHEKLLKHSANCIGRVPPTGPS